MKDQVRTPLRTVLRNFLNHIEKLESSTCPEKSYEAEFQDLKLFSETVKASKDYACAEGEKETNRKKNRYKDILPFDVSRVILNDYAGIPGSDYINANFIKGASGSPAYIASQGPLPCTVNDFWRMVVQCEVQVIVMACNEEEAGKAKCEKYWVDEGVEKQFGMISVKLLKSSTVCPDFSVRTMRLKYTNCQNIIEERTVCQLHYVAWPDHGVPTVVQPLLEMVRLVRDTQASETLPVLVHCSAGCGRTGTICAIDYVWGLLRTGKLTDDFSLLALIREMRRQRIAMVQTKEQYVLVHQAVRELFKEQLLMIDSHPYENVDPDGLLIMKEEENHYDTVESFSSLDFEEKKDSTMEKDVAPPLPQKKHTFYSSKQEKDVENLSAQQRSMIHNSSKKTLNQTVSCMRSSPRSSVSSESIQLSPSQLIHKKLSNPIPSKGILRVPHLRSINSSSPVKRSKSLKLTNCAFKQKAAVNSDAPVELKRRGSLESNIDENGSVIGEVGYNNLSVEDIESTKDDTSNSSPAHDTPRIDQKYDMLNYLEEKRLLVRSLTTFDMRQKSTVHAVPIDDRGNGHSSASKCKLSRSNTQVDFSRLLGGRSVGRKAGFTVEPTPASPSRKPSTSDQTPLSVFISKRVEPASIASDKRQKPGGPSKIDDCQNIYQGIRGYDDKQPLSQIAYQKDEFKSSHLRSDLPMHLMHQSKILIGKDNVGRRPHANPILPPSSRPPGAAAYQYGNKPENLTSNGKSPRFKDTMYTNYVSPSTSRNFDGQKLKSSPINKHLIPPPFHNGRPINDGHHKFSYMNGSMNSPMKYDFRSNKPGEKPDLKNPLPVQGGVNQECGPPLNPLKKLETPNVGSMHPGYRVGPTAHMKTNTAAHFSYPEKPAVMRKQIDHTTPRLGNKQGSYSPRDVEERYGADTNCVQPLPLNMCVLDGDTPSKASNPSNRPWPPTYRTNEHALERNVDLSDETPHLKTQSDVSLQKNLTISSGYPPPPQDGLKKRDYFSNAPGVDLDQVAASIPQKDASKTNLMKVALEAFSIRRSRQQARLPDSSPSTSSSSKGSSPSSTMGGGKKKQQQYL